MLGCFGMRGSGDSSSSKVHAAPAAPEKHQGERNTLAQEARSTVSDMLFPMYLMRLSKFLDIHSKPQARLEAHQAHRCRGDLITLDDVRTDVQADGDPFIIFISQ